MNRVIFNLLLSVTINLGFFGIAQAQGLRDSIGSIFGEDEPVGPCPYKKYEIRSVDPIELNHRGDQLMEKQKYCEAIAYYTRAMIETLTAEPRTYAWYRIVEASFNQRDYEQLFREAEEYLMEKPQSQYSERVHYLAVKAIYENIELTKGKESEWIQRSLGFFDSTPNEEGVGLRKPNFSFRAFLSTYPDSIYRFDVEDMAKKVRLMMTEKVLKEARMLAMRYEYLPAINQLKMIVSQGPVIDQFAEALFELIRITEGFAYSVESENRIPAKRLAKWIMMKEEQISPAIRKQIAEKLLSQAQSMKADMRAKLPENEWTKRLDW